MAVTNMVSFSPILQLLAWPFALASESHEDWVGGYGLTDAKLWVRN